MSDARVGVFICACGSKIASVLNLDAIASQVRALPGVVTAQRLPYACSPDGLRGGGAGGQLF